jgi:hypothetical protein
MTFVAPPQPTECRCGSPVVGWGSVGDQCESCWEDAQDFMRDELRAAAYDAAGVDLDEEMAA